MAGLLSFPDAVPVLAARELRLRELTEADIPAWFERATDADSADLAGDPIPSSIEQGAAWLQRHRDRFIAKTALRWAIEPEAASASAGTVGLIIDPRQRDIADFAIVVGRAFWRKGVGTIATRLVTSYGFEKLGLSEIRAEVLQRNPASIRLLEKAGFVRVREVPGDPASGADPDDCYAYALSRERWSAAR
jgi:ribosomal-protein-alanine N-acetyltransferase